MDPKSSMNEEVLAAARKIMDIDIGMFSKDLGPGQTIYPTNPTLANLYNERKAEFINDRIIKKICKTKSDKGLHNRHCPFRWEIEEDNDFEGFTTADVRLAEKHRADKKNNKNKSKAAVSIPPCKGCEVVAKEMKDNEEKLKERRRAQPPGEENVFLYESSGEC